MGGTIDQLMSQDQGGTQVTSNPIDSLMQQGPGIDDIMRGARPAYDPDRLLPRQVALPPDSEDPGLLARIAAGLKEQGLSLVQFGKYALTSGYNPAVPITLATTGLVRDDIIAASQGDAEALKRLHRGQTGAALAASTIASTGIAAAIKPAVGLGAPLVKRAAAFLTAEALGGATNGALRPLEDDEDRAEAIKEDMIMFPIAGAAMHGIFKGVGKLFKGFRAVSPEVENELKNMSKDEASAVARMTKEIVDEAGPAPNATAEAALHGEALETATKRIVGQRRPTTATARLAEEPVPPEGPDFTVDINEPPPGGAPAAKPPEGPINPLGTTLSKVVDESEAARLAKPPADIPSGITSSPSTSLTVNALPGSVVREADGTLKKVYHGTGKEFAKFDEQFFNPMGLFGPGAYHTDNPDIAGGYAGSNGAPFNNRLLQHQKSLNEIERLKQSKVEYEKALKTNPGYTREHYEDAIRQIDKDIEFHKEEISKSLAQVRPAYLDIKNPFDIDKSYTVEEINKLFAKVDFGYNEDMAKKITGAELYDDLVRDMGDKSTANDALMEVGFDGITHIGGNRTAAGKAIAPEGHRVYIAFSPDQVHTPWEVELQEIMKASAKTPDSPIAQAAVADAVADAVVEETSPLELMPREMAEEATKTPELQTPVGISVGDMLFQAEIDGIVDPSLSLSMLLAKAEQEMKGTPLSRGLRAQAGIRISVAAKINKQSTDPIVDDLLDLAKIAEGFEKGEPNPLGELGGTADPGAGQFKQSWSRLSEEQLDALRRILERFLRSDAGAVSARAATRIAATALSGASFYAADQQDDPMARNLLNGVGGILALGSLVPGKATQQWLKESKFAYRIIKAFNAGRVAGDGSKEGMAEWQAITSQGRAMAKMLESRLRTVFPDKLSQEAAMHALDEGPLAPEFATLTKEQQKEVASQAILNKRIGDILTQLGIISDPREHYVRHLFRDSNIQRLRFSTWENLGKSGNFAKQRQFATLREAIAWAKANGKELPVMDPAVAQAFHMMEVTKAIGNVRIQDRFEQLGMLRDFNPDIVAQSGNLKPGDQWRQVRLDNLSGKMAPDDVATVLERAAAGAGKFGIHDEWLKAMDSAKAHVMRGIMFWAWEHGINVWRGALALDGTGAAYREAMKRLRSADPLVIHAAKYVDLFRRPDFGASESVTGFDRILQKIGQKAPTLKKIGVAFDDFRVRAERKLWDEHVPALGLAAWSREMHLWAERTGGKFGVGSPEYEAAARKAGGFANNVMGKIPELIQDPAVSFLMRQALFSPQWTRTRLSIIAHASGELQKIASGEIKPNEATYLAYKMRSLLLGIALTAAASYALTRRWPTFNPNTQKFYMHTGVKDHNGREVGVDLLGWWQDDLKVFNSPWTFLRDRQNPFLRMVGTQVSGRDVFGRPITGAERLENIIGSMGPAGELVLGGSSFVTDPHAGAADALRAASGVAAVGNVAALPRESDAIVAKMAAKILRQAGLPDDSDRVFELSRLMRQNFTQQGTLYGGEITSWLAYQRRAYRRRGVPWLWQEGKRVLRDMAK